MRKILYITILMMGAWSCILDNNNDDVPEGSNSPKIENDSKTFGPEGGAYTFSLTSDFAPSYEIIDGEGWIIPTSKASNYELHFEILPNETINPRQGKIIFTTKTHVWNLEVKQQGVTPVLHAKTEVSTVFSSEATNFEVLVYSNVPVTLTIPEECAWISQDGEPSKEDFIVYSFDVAANEDYDPREATLTFSNAECSLSSQIHVTQAQKDAFILARSDMDVAEEGERISFEISRNVNFSTSVNCSWIVPVTVAPRGLIQETISFDILPNETDGPRDGSITFASVLGEQVVAIHQLWHEHLLDNTVPGVYGFGAEAWALRDGVDVISKAFFADSWTETFICPGTGVFFSAGGIDNNINIGDDVDIDIIQNYSAAIAAQFTRRFTMVGETEELVYLKDSDKNGLVLKK